MVAHESILQSRTKQFAIRIVKQSGRFLKLDYWNELNSWNAPTGLRPPAQRCRLGYVGKRGRKLFSTATRLRGLHWDPQTQAQPRCG